MSKLRLRQIGRVGVLLAAGIFGAWLGSALPELTGLMIFIGLLMLVRKVLP